MNIDLNEIPNEENYEPFISQTFSSEEEALVFYRNDMILESVKIDLKKKIDKIVICLVIEKRKSTSK